VHHVSRGFAALLASMTLGCVLLLTGAAQASPASAAHAAMAAPQQVAPPCVHFTQEKHGNFFTGYYTNVYLDNTCNRITRVKVVMRNGYDSDCIQLRIDELGHYFRSDSDDGAQPNVDRLEAC